MTGKKWALLLASIGAILMGLLMIIFPAVTLNIVVIIIAIALIGFGIFYTIYYFVRKGNGFTQFDLIIGLGAILLGLFDIVRLQLVVDIFPILIGFALSAVGFFTLQNMINLIKIGRKSWIFLLVLSIICVGFGMLLCLTTAGSSIIMVLLGIALACGGVAILVCTFILRDQIKSGTFSVDETITSWSDEDNNQ